MANTLSEKSRNEVSASHFFSKMFPDVNQFSILDLIRFYINPGQRVT